MQRVDIVVEGDVSTSVRARQVSSMFDAPPQEKCRLEWHFDVDLHSQPWSVGLVVGPSGSGKTTVMRHLWGEPRELQWPGRGVCDDFGRGFSIEQISGICQAVGFNTIPAWMRPYRVLSNGEKFRVDLARRLLEGGDPVVVDEFTSVVDRQVAKIGAHAVQKYVRKTGGRFVAVGCHYDVVDWLQPDWVLDMSTRSFTRRLLQRRPAIDCVVGRLPIAAWQVFAPYHYLTAELHRAAKCFGLWCDGQLAGFAAVIPCPVSSGPDKGKAIWRVSRVVTLPDYQGVGLAFVLLDALGSEYKAKGQRLRNYPAHPAFVRAHDRSTNWALARAPGRHSSHSARNGRSTITGAMGGRPCAVFEYCGPSAIAPALL